MILATPIAAPHPVDFFLKPSPKESSAIATAACSTASNLPCSIPVRVGLFFDGTNNNPERDRDGKRTGLIDPTTKMPGMVSSRELKPEEFSHSNVERLFQAFPAAEQKNGYFRNYVPGVGTPFPEIGELTESDDGKAFAKGGQPRIVWGLLQVLNALHRTAYGNKVLFSADPAGKMALDYDNKVGRSEWDVEHRRHTQVTHRDWFEPHLENLKTQLAKQPKPTIPSLTVSVFGFSRGAAQATAFCHFFSELLSNGKLAGIPASIDFLGVFDKDQSKYFDSTTRAARAKATIPEAIAHPPRLKTDEGKISKIDGAAWQKILENPCDPATVKAIQSIAKHNARIYEEVFQHTPRDSMKTFDDIADLKFHSIPYPLIKGSPESLKAALAVDEQRRKDGIMGPVGDLHVLNGQSFGGVVPPALKKKFMTTVLLAHQKAALNDFRYSRRHQLYADGTVHDVAAAIKHLRDNVVGFFIAAPLDWGRDQTIKGDPSKVSAGRVDIAQAPSPGQDGEHSV